MRSDSPARNDVPTVPQPRSPERPPPSDGDRGHPASQEHPLLSQRLLLILMIAIAVGLVAGTVTAVTVATTSNTTLGMLLGFASGLVTLTLTSLVVATKLHKLVK